jgi:hypothetical protein
LVLFFSLVVPPIQRLLPPLKSNAAAYNCRVSYATFMRLLRCYHSTRSIPLFLRKMSSSGTFSPASLFALPPNAINNLQATPALLHFAFCSLHVLRQSQPKLAQAVL